jgi:hypothetical protein
MPTDLDDYADDPVDFDRVVDLTEHRYTIKHLVVCDADEIPGEYPQYGSFMDVTRVADDAEIWIETPRGLGRAIRDAGLGSGDVIDVTDATKSSDGSWQFTLK